MEKDKCYEVMEHTAELALLVRGGDLKELFANAGYALFDVLCDLSKVQEKVERTLRVEARDREQLMVNWLNELIYLYEVEGLLFKSFSVKTVGDTELVASVKGEERAEYHAIHTELKAVTHHGLKITRENACWQAKVLVDI